MCKEYIKNNIVAFLLSSGSAQEKISGISHLLEHIIISKLRKINSFRQTTGFTTEDYIFIISQYQDYQDIVSSIEKLEINNDDLEKNKKIVIHEINLKQNLPEMKLYESIWHNTQYKNAPHGKLREVKNITVQDLIELKTNIIKMPIYVFDNNRIRIINGRIDSRKPNIDEKTDYVQKKQIVFKDKNYNVYFFINSIEKLHLLEKIFQLNNTDKHIQLIERKEISALIIEEGFVLPYKKEISSLRENALNNIKKEIRKIKKNFLNKSINELESFFFYNLKWENRINRLFTTSIEDIEYIIERNKLP